MQTRTLGDALLVEDDKVDSLVCVRQVRAATELDRKVAVLFVRGVCQQRVNGFANAHDANGVRVRLCAVYLSG